jgi:hypothetical protein
MANVSIFTKHVVGVYFAALTEQVLCEVATELTPFQIQEAEEMADKWMIEPKCER